MHEESRKFLVLLSDGSRKELTGRSIELIMLKTLTYLVGLQKDFTLLAIIDEANAKIYGDFEWDFSYSEKNKEWLTGSPKLYQAVDVERAVMAYGKFLGLDPDGTANWLARQEI